LLKKIQNSVTSIQYSEAQGAPKYYSVTLVD